jgi:glycosyltransferase involved in cell wall biosynthesis
MIRIFEYAMFYMPNPGTIDRNRFEVARRLDPRKFKVSAFANAYDFPNHIMPIPPTNKVDALLKIFSFNPDIIHTRAWPRCLIMRHLIRLRNLRCKHILTLHGMPEGNFQWGKLLARDADLVTCVSKNTADLAKREYGVDSTVIYDGVDTEFFRPKEHHNERLRILFVGRYVEFKKPHYVIKLAKYFPECDFVLYGGGDSSPLTAEASKLNNVTVNPPVPHERMPSIYANSDVFLFPSMREGFSNVVLEALACGVPVVCFNTSSFSEIIRHSRSGLLANNMSEMRKHLQYLIEDEEARREFSTEARKEALQFDWEAIAPKWADLFELAKI